MKIGFDARYLSHGITGGVRTYVYNLARELPRIAPDCEFVYYADAKAPFELPDLPSNASLRILPYSNVLSSIRNDFSLGRHMERDGVDVVHCPGNYGPSTSLPLVVTLHDALNLFPMSQHLRGFGKRPRQVAMMMYLGRKTFASLARTTRLITVSHHAKRDIAEKSGFPLERIDVTYEAASGEFALIDDRRVLDECRRRYELPRPFVLGDGIKNAQATIEAYSALPESIQNRFDLVFFSREAAPRPPVSAALTNPRIRFIAQPPTADLIALMNLASLFAFPSWYEGFGLPLVEAMRCGTPIIASSRAAIPEIVGDAGVIFDLEDPSAYHVRLQALLGDDDAREALRTRALARGRTFSWQETARQTLAVYEKVCAVQRRHIA